MLAIAGFVSANIVDGGFDAAVYKGSDFIDADIDLDNGWVQARNNWTIVAGAMEKTKGSAGKGLGQAFTFSGTGTRTLKFDFVNAIAGTSANSQVYLIGMTGSGNYVTGNGNDEVKIGDLLGLSKQPGTGGNYTPSYLISTVVTATGGDGTFFLSFTASDTYASYYFAVASGDNGVGSFTIDNVSIVPEPATVGMLGLGALVALLVRRIRA
jgi:hypothetical protein